MKRFGSLIVAAILGSTITLISTGYFTRNNEPIKIEHVAVPSTPVAYPSNSSKSDMVPLDFTTTAEKVTKAVVHIRSTDDGRTASRQAPDAMDPFQFFFGPNGPRQDGPSQSSGSGVIINPDGYIVTNNHVVQGADIVDVTLFDNRSFKAEVIGTDPDTDLAVIKIKQSSLPFLSFVDSDKSKVGEWVLAVGNPFNLNSTVTAGIISAKGRRNLELGSKEIEIQDFFQTDAAINPGNSGGPLFLLRQDRYVCVGINTAKIGNADSLGFAISSSVIFSNRFDLYDASIASLSEQAKMNQKTPK